MNMDRLLAGAVRTLPRVTLVMEISIDYACKPDNSAVFYLPIYAFLGVLCVFARGTSFFSRPLAALTQAATVS